MKINLLKCGNCGENFDAQLSTCPNCENRNNQEDQEYIKDPNSKFKRDSPLLKIWGITITLLLLFLGLTLSAKKTEDYLKKAFIENSELIDPATVIFRNVSALRKPYQDFWCGEYNAKNRFGGYVGWDNFILKVKYSDHFTVDKSELSMLDISNTYLSNTISEEKSSKITKAKLFDFNFQCKKTEKIGEHIPLWWGVVSFHIGTREDRLEQTVNNAKEYLDMLEAREKEFGERVIY